MGSKFPAITALRGCRTRLDEGGRSDGRPPGDEKIRVMIPR